MFLQVQHLGVSENGFFKVICRKSYLVAATWAVPELKGYDWV